MKKKTTGKSTASLTIDEFRKISRDVGYEIRMLNNCVASLFGLAAKAGGVTTYAMPMKILVEDVFQNNLLVEGIAVHSRVLITFLFPQIKPIYNTDISAFDYYNNTTTWKWQSDDLKQNKLLYDCKTWADESLAHMTTARLNTKSVPDYSKICTELSNLVDTFVADCPQQEKIDDGLRNWRLHKF